MFEIKGGKPRSSALRSYRRRGRGSVCRKLKLKQCRKYAACKYASGSKRNFCRKKSNTRRGGPRRANKSRRLKQQRAPPSPMSSDYVSF